MDPGFDLARPRPFRWSCPAPLPHLEAGPRPQSVTFRLANSLPRGLVEAWEAELAHLPPVARLDVMRRRMEDALDQTANALLTEPRVARRVVEALRFFDGRRYVLHAWVVMPTHVHAQLTPLAGREVGRIVQGWKSFTAHEANRVLGRRGALWAPDWHDRLEEHCADVPSYIEWNPVVAGLARVPWEYPWSSAWGRVPGGPDADPPQAAREAAQRRLQ